MFNFNGAITLVGGTNNQFSAVFSVHGGVVYFRVWEKSSDSKPALFFLPISYTATTMIIEYLNEATTAEIGYKKELRISRWNYNDKKFTDTKTITIGKGNGGIVYIGVKGDTLVEEEKFQFKVPGAIEVYPEPLTDEQSSNFSVKSFTKELYELSTTAVYLSRDNDTMEKKRDRKEAYVPQKIKSSDIPTVATPPSTESPKSEDQPKDQPEDKKSTKLDIEDIPF